MLWAACLPSNASGVSDDHLRYLHGMRALVQSPYTKPIVTSSPLIEGSHIYGSSWVSCSAVGLRADGAVRQVQLFGRRPDVLQAILQGPKAAPIHRVRKPCADIYVCVHTHVCM